MSLKALEDIYSQTRPRMFCASLLKNKTNTQCRSFVNSKLKNSKKITILKKQKPYIALKANYNFFFTIFPTFILLSFLKEISK